MKSNASHLYIRIRVDCCFATPGQALPCLIFSFHVLSIEPLLFELKGSADPTFSRLSFSTGLALKSSIWRKNPGNGWKSVSHFTWNFRFHPRIVQNPAFYRFPIGRIMGKVVDESKKKIWLAGLILPELLSFYGVGLCSYWSWSYLWSLELWENKLLTTERRGAHPSLGNGLPTPMIPITSVQSVSKERGVNYDM